MTTRRRSRTGVWVGVSLVLSMGCGSAPAPAPSSPPSTPPSTPSSTTTAQNKALDSEPGAPGAGAPSKPTEATPESEPSRVSAGGDAQPTKTADAAAPAAPLPAPASCEPKGNRATAGKGSAPAAKAPKLELKVDRAKVDLEGHRLEVKLTRPACKVVLKVIGESGAVLADVAQGFDGAAAGTALVVGWSPSSAEPVTRIEVWGHDTEGYYVGVAITPWNVKIPHEEVNFESDSDAIRPSEVPKLEASLQKVNEMLSKHKDLGKISLFIVGHTDSVGGSDHNLKLSRRRAMAIASWFRGRGLKIPIAHEGLGEFSQLVKTADEVAEPRNRRVDYILSLEPPHLPTGTVTFSWKGL